MRRFLGRSHMLLNAPDAIHHVLVDNHANYRRSPASIRILRPITGNGLLLSDGEDWRLQRRTIAPALAPRTLPVLARHIVTCADDAIGMLGAQTNQPMDLLAAMQNLALDIAGRSMFSLETRQYGAAMRRLLTEYAHELLEAASVRHGAAAVDPDTARLRPPALPAPLDGADGGDHAGTPGRARHGYAARPVRSAARRARSGDRQGFLARPAARSDRHDDPGGTRDHRGDAVLVAGPAGRRAR